MSSVFVLDQNKQPLDPCHPAWARKLLRSGQAAVFRRYPFTIILKAQKQAPADRQLTTHSYRVKIDPGSRTTGFAIVCENSGCVVWAAELEHRGQRIQSTLLSRRALRRNRRNRHTRYRPPRFLNRRRREGWLAPSLQSRVDNVVSWVKRLMCLCPITAISQELVRFDTQKMQNPETSGTEYQQGTLQGYEIREYLLEKWGRKCAYCNAEGVPLQIEHIIPKSQGGTNRVSNLTLACHRCNQKKGNQTIEKFLARKPDLLKRIKSQVKVPLKDVAAVNSTRRELLRQLEKLGVPMECGTGGLTKYNRTQRNLRKTHWIDAACVGTSTPELLLIKRVKPLAIKAMGHGKRQRCRTDKFGFPKCHAKRKKRCQGFKTGDMVKAVIPRGKNAGTHIGRIIIKFQGNFDLQSKIGQKKISVNPKDIRTIHHSDGFQYSFGEETSLMGKPSGC